MRTYLLFLLLICISQVTALQFSELLPNPEGADNYKEYVKLTGTEDLSECSIKDLKSSDKLKQLQKGDETIVIVEDNSTLLPLEGPTIYSAGSAIGNGLDNTHDELSIICDNETIASTAYDITTIDGYKDGMPILWDGKWKVEQQEIPHNTTANISKNTTKPVFEIPLLAPCNDTLLITVSNSTMIVGQRLSFTVITASNASVDVKSQNETIYEGDTTQFNEFGIIVPDTDMLRISAQTAICDGTQHATRIITVERPAEPIQKEIEPVEVITPVKAAAPKPPEPSQPIQKEVPLVTGEVIMDNDRSAIPWIAGFGIVTLIVSATVFFKAER